MIWFYEERDKRKKNIWFKGILGSNKELFMVRFEGLSRVSIMDHHWWVVGTRRFSIWCYV